MEDVSKQELQNQQIVSSLSGIIKSQKLTLDEFLQANIQLKASVLILEENIKKINEELSDFKKSNDQK